ncbi:UPF0472 protein C16orf72 homolog [Drosophila sechellia]|uniref:GD17308 n=3 Tax=melanogaster subgroup TaxID=32351 RepID=B4R634_DROSI|nr:UPF0472 protein C16orf72 homolog [Drosophila sechellia]XP_002107161.1 UPF0472 protein C16orf72 homolog [Drosophila simulans]XP_033168759.1 UPF0472 protein C16orf72 homolog [Drosophila mauritiana]EDW46189.1 GM13468 [Drosophila sechellia]EDX18138.1 GD17308 [Drosophila simulans]KMZ10237.1 uncharacterized protein Dsimw501_GD17308 [Drosophila simulans]
MQQQPESGGEESWLEEQCHREIHGQHDEYEREFVRQRDNNLGTVWGAFQDSATAVAQLYRERSSNTFSSDTGALWLPFQTAAGTVTTLYKESCDGLKRTSDAAIQCGYQRRTRELADWARSKKRRMIRREDLLAYLAGKPLPPSNSNPHANRRSPKPEHHHQSGSGGSGLGFHGSGLGLTGGPLTAAGGGHLLSAGAAGGRQEVTGGAPGGGIGDDLHTFKEALVLRPRGPELFAFVANEIARHCKRPGSPIDDKMDICHYSSKRQRFM